MPAFVLIFLFVIFVILPLGHLPIICLTRLSLSLHDLYFSKPSRISFTCWALKRFLPIWSRLSVHDLSQDVRDVLHAELYS